MSEKELKKRVYNCNKELYLQGLVVQTFRNVSWIYRDKNIIAIKPIGISCDKLNVDDIVLVDLNNQIVDCNLKPSSDSKTHIFLYKAIPSIGDIVHTHSAFATVWSQAKKSIPCFDKTHAGYIQEEISCTEQKKITHMEYNNEYNNK